MITERTVDRIWVLTLYGDKAEQFETVEDALAYLDTQPDEKSGRLVRIEIQARFETGQQIDGTFRSKADAMEFLRNRQRGML